MRTTMQTTIIAGVALLANGCGQPSTSGSAPPGATATAGASGWNTMDACATLGRDAAAAATGRTVTGTELGPMKAPEDGMASFSTCTFQLADGAKLSVLTREGKGENTPEAIAMAKSPPVGEPGVDVPGLGRAAIWTDKPPSLQVFIGDDRYATISLYRADGMPDASANARAAAMKVAQKLVG